MMIYDCHAPNFAFIYFLIFQVTEFVLHEFVIYFFKRHRAEQAGDNFQVGEKNCFIFRVTTNQNTRIVISVCIQTIVFVVVVVVFVIFCLFVFVCLFLFLFVCLFVFFFAAGISIITVSRFLFFFLKSNGMGYYIFTWTNFKEFDFSYCCYEKKEL